MSDKISVSLSPAKVKISPGESAQLTISIKNTSEIVEAYSIVIEGIDPSWHSLSASSLSLFPKDKEEVKLTIQPPKSSESLSGEYNITVKVVSGKDPSEFTAAQVGVDLGRYLIFDLGLSPTTAKGSKGKYKLSITNKGNVPTNYTLAGEDRDEACRFEFKPETVLVEPGKTTEVDLLVSPKKRPFTGRSKVYSFKVTATPHASPAGEPKSVEGQFECTPRMPKWVLPAVGVALVVLIALIALLATMKGGHNTPPVISSISANPTSVAVGGTATIVCYATDADNNPLTYDWTATGGTISGSSHTQTVTLITPNVTGSYTVTVTVSDNKGGTVSSSVTIAVVAPTPTPTPTPTSTSTPTPTPTPALSEGSIHIQSSPAGAKVIIDGDDTGSITEYTAAHIAAGNHTIRLERDYYKWRQETVTVHPGETTDINWALTSASSKSLTIQPSADAYVDPENSGDGFGTALYLKIGSIMVHRGYITNPITGKTTPLLMPEYLSAYILFNLNSIPSTARITNAQLGLFYCSNSSNSTSTQINVYQVTSSWNQIGITYNNSPTTAQSYSAYANVPAAFTNNFLYWSISDLVQGWINVPITNYGVKLTGASVDKGFYSSEYPDAAKQPKLTIYYWDPDPSHQ